MGPTLPDPEFRAVTLVRTGIPVTPPRQTDPMKRQLVLLEDAAPAWRLDDRTREVGRQGIAKAREALRRAEQARRERDGLAEPAQRTAA